ncbi:DUF6538 domain-containing protein [Nitrobacter sp. TKz-YC02]|uniref:DUF6538 domain-containing protein n=1 Tax=Nitrobacter sp. TKz-YC02 TaxID=3398704 RepID=UPI003CEA1423
MPLAMSRPWKHPKSGVYWLRRAVPADLRRLVGKREEKQTLGTKDPAEAKRLHAKALAELEARWGNLRAGSRQLTEREAHELAAPIYDLWLAKHREDPSGNPWRTDVFERMWRVPTGREALENCFEADSQAARQRREDDERAVLQQSLCLMYAGDVLEQQGIVLDPTHEIKLEKAVAVAIQRASLLLARLKRGEFEATVPGVWGFGIRPIEPKKPVSFKILLDRWAAERKPAEKTRYEWTRVFNEFCRHVQHDDANLVTRDDIVSWKNSLVDAGGSTKTIRDAKLAPIRAIFQVAVDNQLLPINPAANLPIKLKAKPGQGRRGYTNAEARIVLAAAGKASDPVRRWVPILGAYSGARVAEICQLRVQDISEIDGIHCMSFTAEAGPLKTESSERTIPIHTAVIDAGFLEFVASIKSGPLFIQLKPDKFGSRGGTGTKVLGRWIRSLGLKDPRLAPNHSWRHRMRTLARDYMLQPDLIDAITGHRKRTVADGYGEFPMPALKRELDKIPALSLSLEEA